MTFTNSLQIFSKNPRVLKLFLAATLARSGIAMIPLSIVILVSQTLHSMTLAGVTAGTFALAGAASVPLQGYFVDRYTHRVIILPAIGFHCVSLLAMTIAIQQVLPSVVIVGLAGLAGFSYPSISPVLRAAWPSLFEKRTFTQTAIALDAVAVELVFVVGPLFVALLTTLHISIWALWLSAMFTLGGGVWFTMKVPLRSSFLKHSQPSQRINAFAFSGIRVLLLCSLTIGVGLGSFEVLFTIFTQRHHAPGYVGIAMAALSLGSMTGGLIYSSRFAHRNTTRNYLTLITLLPITFTFLVFASSPFLLTGLALIAGLWLAPIIAAQSDLAGQLIPNEKSTEVYSWLLTALILGVALGNALSGFFSATFSWEITVLCLTACMSFGTIYSWLRRKAIHPEPSHRL